VPVITVDDEGHVSFDRGRLERLIRILLVVAASVVLERFPEVTSLLSGTSIVIRPQGPEREIGLGPV